MVYCDLIKNENKLLTYKIGGFASDLTGLIVFHTQNATYELIKEPENSKVYKRHLERLARRCKGMYDKGIVKNKLSLEIG